MHYASAVFALAYPTSRWARSFQNFRREVCEKVQKVQKAAKIIGKVQKMQKPLQNRWKTIPFAKKYWFPFVFAMVFAFLLHFLCYFRCFWHFLHFFGMFSPGQFGRKIYAIYVGKKNRKRNIVQKMQSMVFDILVQMPTCSIYSKNQVDLVNAPIPTRPM